MNKQRLKLMTHIVAGYPDFKTNLACLQLMEQQGVDFIEIQFPFSDPMADGPTIMRANQLALDNGTTLKQCLNLLQQASKQVSIPLFVMTYLNIPFKYGINRFIDTCLQKGASGFIIPDLPYLNEQYSEKNLIDDHIAKTKLIKILSPHMNETRLTNIVANDDAHFLYVTLKVGITGARQTIADEGLNFLSKVKNLTNQPIAAGFGISSPQHLKMLKGKADIAVIGSHLINTLDTSGLKGIEDFLKDCKNHL